MSTNGRPRFIVILMCGLLVAGAGQAQVVTDDLVFEANANTDTNANDGWDFTQPAVSGGGGTLVVGAGAPVHGFTPEGGGFFRSTGINQNFAGAINGVFLSDFSCEFWLRRNGDNSEGQLASFRRTSSFSGNMINLAMTATGPSPGGQDNQLADVDFRDMQAVREGNFDRVPVPVDAWKQVVITYRDASSQGAADGIMNVYTDGNPTPVASFTNNVFMAGGLGSVLGYVTTHIVNLGQGNRGFQGDIGIVRFYDVELTPAQVTQNFEADGLKYGLIVLPLALITDYLMTGQMGFAISTDSGLVYELLGSDDGTNFVSTGGFVRGDGGAKILHDPRGDPTQAVYQIIRGSP